MVRVKCSPVAACECYAPSNVLADNELLCLFFLCLYVSTSEDVSAQLDHLLRLRASGGDFAARNPISAHCEHVQALVALPPSITISLANGWLRFFVIRL